MKKIILLLTGCFYLLQVIHAQPGSLDPSFGYKGIVKTNLGVNYNYGGNAKKVLTQPDGGIFIITDRGENLSAILKLHRDGTPDLSYRNKGTSDLITMTVNSGAMQADGKIIVAGSSGIYFAIARYNTDGSIDRAFGVDGVATIDFGISFSSHDYAYAKSVAIGNDGKIVALGNEVYSDFHLGSPFSQVALARFNTDGSPDNTFNGNGQLLKIYGEYDDATSVAIQTDKKVIIIVGGDSYPRIVRFNADGSLDNTFIMGDATPVGPIAIQSDGKILISGARLNTNGSIDVRFSTDYSISAIVIQTDGKIVVAGYKYDIDQNEERLSSFVIERFTNELQPDNTFSGDGKQTTKFSGSNSVAVSMAIQSDGKILVGGYLYGQITSLALARYNTNGTPDNLFDGDGKLTSTLLGPNTIYTTTAIQDGKLVAAGKAWNGHDFDFALTRYNVDGSLDNTFNGDGKQTTDFNSGNDYLNSIAIQSNGKIVVTGITVTVTTEGYPDNKFIIVRYNVDGSLDKGFSADGVQTSNYEIKSIAIQGDDKIVAVGASNENSNRALRLTTSRYNSDGTVDTNFGEDGSASITFIDSYQESTGNSITVQPDGKIVAVGSAIHDYLEFDFLTVRFLNNGSIDNTFSDDGIQTTNNGNIVANAVGIQSDGTIIVAGNCNNARAASSIAVASYNTNGGSLKFVQKSLGTDFSDFATSVAIQSNDKIVVAGKSASNFALVRFNKDLIVDNTFSGDGIRIINASPGNDVINGIAISGNKLYAAGTGQFPGNLGIVARYLLDNNQNKAPTVSITLPANNAIYGAPAGIFIRAAANDQDGSIQNVAFYNGNTLLHTEYLAPYGFLWKDVPVGSYTLTAKATDNSGLSSTSAGVHVSVIVSSTPVVKITSPADNSTFSAPASIKINATATDPAGISKVEFYNDTKLLHTEHLAPYGFLYSNVPVDKYTLTVKATNNNGVTATAVVHVTVTNTTIAMSQNVSKSIADFSNEPLSLRLSPNPVHNTLNVSINGKLNKPTELYVLSASGVLLKNIHSLAANQLPLNVSSLANGVYFIKIVSGDKVMYKQFVKL